MTKCEEEDCEEESRCSFCHRCQKHHRGGFEMTKEDIIYLIQVLSLLFGIAVVGSSLILMELFT